MANEGTYLRKCDYQIVAKTCNSTEAAVQYTLKQIAIAIETAMKMKYSIKLNLRIGWLKFSEGNLFFDNLAANGKQNNGNNPSLTRGFDQTTLTSCNTEFRANKWFMTDFRSPQNQTTTNQLGNSNQKLSLRMSLHDAISSFASAKTPKTVTSTHSLMTRS